MIVGDTCDELVVACKIVKVNLLCVCRKQILIECLELGRIYLLAFVCEARLVSVARNSEIVCLSVAVIDRYTVKIIDIRCKEQLIKHIFGCCGKPRQRVGREHIYCVLA